MIAVSFISYSFLFFIALPISLALLVRAACLPVPCRGRDELCGLCVALCSRLIASVSSGILFLVPCDGFLSAFLFLARCCCMSGFIPSLYRSRPTPSSFLLGYQGRGRFFYRFTCLLRHLSRSSHVLPLCGYSDSISQYRPVHRPACSTRGTGRLWLRGACLREGLSAELYGLGDG